MARSIILGTGTALLVSAPVHRRRALALAEVWITVIALTRVYLGEHWASDVIGGALIGAAALPAFVIAARQSLASAG